MSPGLYTFSVTCDTTNDPATAVTVSVPFTVTSPSPSRFVGLAPTTDNRGYWLAQAGVESSATAMHPSSGHFRARDSPSAAPIVGIAATADGKGYWLVGADGGVFGFGDATFYGSLPQQHLVASANYLAITHDAIVGITPDPIGGGYWLIGADGGVFGFGTARYRGSATQPSTSASGLTDEPFVGISATADGGGYYEVGYLGGAIAFGDGGTTNGALDERRERQPRLFHQRHCERPRRWRGLDGGRKWRHLRRGGSRPRRGRASPASTAPFRADWHHSRERPSSILRPPPHAGATGWPAPTVESSAS